MPVTPGAVAQGVPAVHPAVVSAPHAGPVSNQLQRVENAHGGSIACGAGVEGFDLRREVEFARFLDVFNPKLSSMMDWCAWPVLDRSLPEFLGSRDLSVGRSDYVNTQERELTEHGLKIHKYASAAFDLARSGYGDTIRRPEFEAFAQSKGVDSMRLARTLSSARKCMPDGPLQFPRVLGGAHRRDASASLRAAVEARLATLPTAFLHHLTLVNPVLELALQWVRPSPESQPAESFTAFASLHPRNEGGLRNYIRDHALSGRGIYAVAYHLAAFEWIQVGESESELPKIAAGLDASLIRRYATQAIASLERGKR